MSRNTEKGSGRTTVIPGSREATTTKTTGRPQSGGDPSGINKQGNPQKQITVEEYRDIQEQLDTVTRQRERVQGALQEILRRLKSQFGCNSLEDARERLTTLDEQLQSQKEAIDVEYQKFEEEYGPRLRGSKSA